MVVCIRVRSKLCFRRDHTAIGPAFDEDECGGPESLKIGSSVQVDVRTAPTCPQTSSTLSCSHAPATSIVLDSSVLTFSLPDVPKSLLACPKLSEPVNILVSPPASPGISQLHELCVRRFPVLPIPRVSCSLLSAPHYRITKLHSRRNAPQIHSPLPSR